MRGKKKKECTCDRACPSSASTKTVPTPTWAARVLATTAGEGAVQHRKFQLSAVTFYVFQTQRDLQTLKQQVMLGMKSQGPKPEQKPQRSALVSNLPSPEFKSQEQAFAKTLLHKTYTITTQSLQHNQGSRACFPQDAVILAKA